MTDDYVPPKYPSWVYHPASPGGTLLTTPEAYAQFVAQVGPGVVDHPAKVHNVPVNTTPLVEQPDLGGTAVNEPPDLEVPEESAGREAVQKKPPRRSHHKKPTASATDKEP